MKILLTGIINFYCLCAGAQTITKYYDADWMETSSEKAIYYATFTKEGDLYKCTSYWKNNNALRGISAYPDTVIANPEGLQLLYNKKGRIEDSVFYENGKVSFYYHYYPNNQLAVHYHLPDNSKEGVTEGYDENGKKIKNYILMKEAEFKGGQSAWENYIKKNISRELTIKGGNGITNAEVQVQFLIDEDGSVIKGKIIKSSGYKSIDNDALRIISESPTWNSAIEFNKPVRAVRIQPVLYNIPPDKK